MSMAYGDFAAFMADVDKAFSTWDKVRPRPLRLPFPSLSWPRDRDTRIWSSVFVLKLYYMLFNVI